MRGSWFVLSLLALGGAVLWQLPLLAAAGSLGAYWGLDGVLRQLQTRSPERTSSLAAAWSELVAVEQTLVLVLVLQHPGTSSQADTVAVVAVVVLAVLRAGWSALRLFEGELLRDRILVRNLRVPGAADSRASRLLSRDGLPLTTWPGLLLSLGAATAVGLSSSGVLVALAGLAVTTALALWLTPLPALFALVRAPRGKAHRGLVLAALQAHAPVVVLYFGGGPGSVYTANTWLPTLERVRQSAFVLLRDPAALERLAATGLPVVCVPGRRDVYAFSAAPLRVSLFPVNETENLRLLRSRHVRSAFIGHGDSDKSGSASPLSRAYDEVWVAGPAGRQRYREAAVGVRDDAIREVGRPQAAGVLSSGCRPAQAPWTVLYAPTWEGLDLGNHETSLEVAGRLIVARLLALPDVRVVYRPHPLTGTRLPAVARASREIVAALQDAGRPHEVLEGDSVDLLSCFNAADALITDVSSVIPDFLASGKPYFVVDVRALPDADFRRAVPSAAAAYVVGPAGQGLVEGLAEARGSDSMRERRLALRDHLLGPVADDPHEVFSRALDELAALRRTPPDGR